MSDAHDAIVVRVRTRSPEETEAVGTALAAVLGRDTVAGLCGPLGAGKTCFARGVAAGLGIDPTAVTSPTFVYLVDYSEGVVPLHHGDLYRLADVPSDAAEQVYESIGLLAAFTAGGMTVVEWWDCYRGPAPAALVRVEFVIENAEHRRIEAHFAVPDGEAIAGRFTTRLAAAGLSPER